eukprot:gene25917-28137_t
MSREDFVGPGHATGAGGFAIAPPAPIDPAQVGVLLGSVREQGDGQGLPWNGGSRTARCRTV